MIKVDKMKLPITKWRTRDNPLKDASFRLWVLRFICKFFRVLYASWSYYFMPFTAIFINFKFMISQCKCWGDEETWSPTDEICDCLSILEQ